MRLLCYYGGTIINNDNSITYNRESTCLTAKLDMSLAKLKYLIY